jgi:hypothetical protein
MDKKLPFSPKSKLGRFIVWLCKTFAKKDVENIAHHLLYLTQNPHPDVPFKDQITNKKFPDYQKFYVDEKAPIKVDPKKNF